MKRYITYQMIIIALLGQSTMLFAEVVKPDAQETSKKKIKQVIADYQSAIVEKDERKFDQLLHRDLISWLETNPDNRTGKLPSQM